MANGLSVPHMMVIATASLAVAGRMSRFILHEAGNKETPYWAQEYSRHIELFEVMANTLVGRGLSARTLRASVRQRVRGEADIAVDVRSVMEAERYLLAEIEAALALEIPDDPVRRALERAKCHIEAFLSFVGTRRGKPTGVEPRPGSAAVPDRDGDEDIVYNFASLSGSWQTSS